MLEEELAAAGFEINVNIGVGTSYASVIEAMASGQVHVGFLTSQQYAYTTLEYPGEVEVLLTSVRDAYEIQIDDDGEEITDKAALVAAANASGYAAETTDEFTVSSYYSMLLVRTEDLDDYADGVADLEGKNVAVQSETSGSGYVYPSFLLYQNGLEFTQSDTPGAGEVQATTVGGHTNAVNALLNGEVDAVFTFFDARYITAAYSTWQTANPTSNIFDFTSVVALTDPIYNDTISGLASLDDGLRAAIQDAFINIIVIDEGAEILAIYNYIGYMVAEDEDYDSERELYQFLHPEE
jgi:phosphonate transport system substrate-binding protein